MFDNGLYFLSQFGLGLGIHRVAQRQQGIIPQRGTELLKKLWFQTANAQIAIIGGAVVVIKAAAIEIGAPSLGLCIGR